MSTINYTYNVIVDRFRQFAAGHFQLRRFTHGEISQADLEKEAEWPWLHVKPRAINYAPGARTFSFEIFISDLPRDKEDKTGYQAESITDCSLIFQDLINEIYLGNMFGSNVELTRPVNSEPFVEQYTHTLTGVTGTIELNLDYDWSACSIPASWNYNTPTDSPSDGWGALQFIESLDQNGVFVSLLNDLEAPGNSYYYGTNASGVKGWYAIVDNVGLTCETLPDCATIISILDDIAALQTDVALKANTADLGATAFSNDYNDLDNLPTIPSIAGLATVTYVDQQDNLKVDKIAGKGLSTEDYTTAEKSKLAGIQAGAEVNVNADWNAVSGDAQILNKPTIPAQYNPTAGTGVSITGTYPNQTITNTAPDQVVALTAGTGIGVSGTYPNFTITNSSPSSGGTVTSVAELTLGTTGTDLSSTVANSTSTPVITLNVPTASATNRGVLSSADWSTFNNKQAALGFTAENTANKQNSLAVDGTGVKFPTVDAVNNLSFIDKFKRGIQYFTDFENTATSTPNFVQFTSGTGASVIRQVTNLPNATASQIGFCQYQTGTTATGYATHINEGFVGSQFFFGGGAWVFETFICVETLSTSLERFRFIAGFGSSATNGAEGNGAFFTYDEGATQNGTTATANWQTQTCVGSVRTLTTTSVAVTAGAWVKLRIEVNAAGTSASFYINGTLVATHTTNIPTWVSAANPRGFNVKQSIVKTIGTTNRNVFCDYLGYENRLTTAR